MPSNPPTTKGRKIDVKPMTYQAQAWDHLFKIVVVGDYMVGKTKLVQRLTTNTFTADYHMTIGVNFAAHQVKAKRKRVQLQIWDTGGQERFDRIRTQYYRGSSGALVCFDTTRIETFNRLNKWISEVKINCGYVPIVLVATKADLKKDRQVEQAIIEELSKDRHIPYYETSAKTGLQVQKCFRALAEEILSTG